MAFRRQILEDGAKFAGIALWTAYFFHAAGALLTIWRAAAGEPRP